MLIKSFMCYLILNKHMRIVYNVECSLNHNDIEG